MSSFHQTIIAGNLGGDPDLRYLPNGDAVCNFGVAVTETWKNQSGEKQERTTWYRVNAFRKLGEICGQYLKKGSSVLIVGKMQTRDWEKEGVKRTAWELTAETMQMLGSPQGSSQPSSSAKPASKPDSASKATSFEDMDDSIPF